MDITLQIIIRPATHALEGMEAACRYRTGDIIDVYRANRFAELQEDGNYLMQSQMGNDVFCYIHIKDVPDTLNRQRIKAKLLEPVTILDELVRRKMWHIPPSILPVAFRQRLLADREATVTFIQAKNYIRRKTTPVLLDPDQDDITTTLTDGDLE